MAHTVFVDGSTVTANRIVAAWLNDADTVTYVRFGDGTSYTGNLTVPGTTSLTGTLTAAAINASGTVAMAGAATVGTTLGVTGALTAGTAGSSVNTISGIDRVLTLVGQTAASTNAFLRFNASSTNKWTIGQYAAGGDQFVVYDDVNAAFGLKIFAGATPSVTIPGALTVTGTSTMAAINASGSLSLTGATVTIAPAASNPTLFINDPTKGSAMIQGGVNTGGTGLGDYWMFNVPTSRGLSWSVNNVSVMSALAAGVTIPGTLGVTGASTLTGNVSFRTMTSTNLIAHPLITLDTSGTGQNLTLDVNDSGSLARVGPNSNTQLDIITANTARITIAGTGAVTIPGTLGVTGSTTLDYLLTVNRNQSGTNPVIAMRNTDAGTGSSMRMNLGNNASANASTIDVFSNTHLTKPNYLVVVNQFDAPVLIGTSSNPVTLTNTAVTIPGTLGVTGVSTLTGGATIGTGSNVLGLKVAYLTADNQLNSSTTLTTLSDLTVAIGAGETWLIEWKLRVGANLEATGLGLAVDTPASATQDVFYQYIPSALDLISGVYTGPAMVQSTTTDAARVDWTAAEILYGGRAIVTVSARVTASGAGNVLMQFAQETSTATSLIVYRGSSMKAQRVT